MHGAWRRLRDRDDPDTALAYLRRSVVNGARSALRHRKVVDKHAPRPLPDAASAEHGALLALEHAEVMAALRRLPERQREVLVLRYYLDLSEASIADTLGISRGAVKSHSARGIAALRTSLETTS
jgi:RNA polymerase sigma-70 factor (sigma-E family)